MPARSSSRVSQRQSCENAWWYEYPPGRRGTFFDRFVLFGTVMSYRSNVCGRVSRARF
jgi:hypothetical protein